MPDRKEELIAQIKARAEQARQISEATESNGGWTSESKERVAALVQEIKTLKERLQEQKDGAGLRAQLDDLARDLGFDPDQGSPPPGEQRQLGKGRSLGAAIVQSPQYKELHRQFPSGRIPERARVNMDPVHFKELVSITGGIGGEHLVPADSQGLIDVLGRYELVLRNLVSVRTTTSDLIEYVRQLTRESNVEWVPEATDLDPLAFPSGETGIKPMGGFTLEIVQAPVESLAQWIPITKRAIMDAAQLRTMIDDELRGDLRDAEETALLYGSGPVGASPGIEGLDSTSGVLAQPYDTNLFVTTRKARSLVRFVGFAVPTAYVLNPEDDEAVDLATDGNNQFFGQGPFAMGPQTLWGLPRVVSPYVRTGEGWVGDWRRAIIWDRQQATISVSDSHADFFIRNLIAVLGEQREAFGITRPSAFVKFATRGGGGG